MSWITPDLIEILLTILKAVVILLVVVTCGAFMSFGERRLLGLFQNRSLKKTGSRNSRIASSLPLRQ